MKRARVIVLAFLLGIFLVQFASAEILFSSMKDKYSLGDTLTATVTVSPTVTNEDYLQVYLNCGDNSSSKDFYKEFVMIPTGEKKEVNVELLLTPRVVGSSIGDCYISATYGPDSARSENFRISNILIVTLLSEKKSFAPSENFDLTGTVKRETLDLPDAFVEITDDKNIINVKGLVGKGEFSVPVVFPDDTAAGSYVLNGHVYEKDSRGFVTNTGNASMTVVVIQVPRRVDVTLNNQEIKPGDIIEFKGSIYDQTDLPMAGELTYSIKDKNGYIRELNVTNTDGTIRFNVSKNELPGVWTVEMDHENISNSRILNILVNQEIRMDLANDSLVITNVGNVPYNKSVSFNIGNKTFEKFVFLELGQSKQVYLTAPEGSYDVFVDDGKTSVNGKGISLTGDAIGVSDSKNKPLLESAGFVYVWVFILLVLILTAVIVYLRIRKQPFRIKKSFNFGGGRHGGDDDFKAVGIMSKPRQLHEELNAVTGDKIDRAVPGFVNDGTKQEVGLVALEIKNYDAMKRKRSAALEELNSIIDKVKDHHSVGYSADNFVFYLYAPTVTKNLKNAVPAVKLATRLEREINEYNKMHQDRIEFGIGVHSGEIIAKKDGRNLRFTAIGSTIVYAKKVAHMADGAVYISEKIQKLAMPEVKAKEVETGSYGGPKIYSVGNVVDRDKNTKFLSDFQERNYGRKY